MSDTPRTDAMIQPVPGKDCVTGEPIDVVHADDCRKLELELSWARGLIQDQADALMHHALMRHAGPSGRDWDQCLRCGAAYLTTHPEAEQSVVDAQHEQEALVAKQAARYRWWLSKWSADSDEAIDELNEALGAADTAEKIDAAIDAAITKEKP